MEFGFDKTKAEDFNGFTGGTLSHNQKLTNKLLQSSSPAYMKSNGLIRDRGFSIQDKDRIIHKVLERTIRGLYYLHFNEILKSHNKIDIGWVETPDDTIECEFNKLDTHEIGESRKFVYQCHKKEEGFSFWRFVVHRCYEFTGITYPLGSIYDLMNKYQV